MPRLLAIAPMCDRDDVGESWSAHQWVKRLAKRYDLTLLTYHKRGHQPPSEQLPEVRVVEWREPPLVGRAERLNSMLKPAYIPFYLRARRWIKRALARGEQFDIGHQVVPLAMRYPSPLAGLGMPYVIGPVGGSLVTPAAFAKEDSAPWYVALRAVDNWRIRHDPLLRHTYRNAACVIGIGPYVADVLAPIGLRAFHPMSDTGVERLPEPVDRAGRTGPLRLLYVGRLVRTKGARDAIRAISLLIDLPVRLDIAGDGFDRGPCESLVTELGLAERVYFHGRIPRSELDSLYKQADVFVFPSYREPGGNVVAEAMAYGLPLVVSDRGGPGYVVDDSCGTRVTPTEPAQYARDIAAAIRALATDAAARTRLGCAARTRIGALSMWDEKVEAMVRIYEKVLAEQS